MIKSINEFNLKDYMHEFYNILTRRDNFEDWSRYCAVDIRIGKRNKNKIETFDNVLKHIIKYPDNLKSIYVDCSDDVSDIGGSGILSITFNSMKFDIYISSLFPTMMKNISDDNVCWFMLNGYDTDKWKEWKRKIYYV